MPCAAGIVRYQRRFGPGLQQDLPEYLDKLFPPGRDYAHERTWQQVFHLECDVRAHTRRIVVTVQGD